MTDPEQQPLITRLFALLRTLQWAALVMALFYVGLAEMLRRNQSRDVSSMFLIVSSLAVCEALAVIYMRLTLIPRAEDILRLDPQDRAGLETIRKWYVVAIAFCAGVSLYGFALRIMGSTFLQAAIFYAAGIALVLFCTPRKPA